MEKAHFDRRAIKGRIDHEKMGQEYAKEAAKEWYSQEEKELTAAEKAATKKLHQFIKDATEAHGTPMVRSWPSSARAEHMRLRATAEHYRSQLKAHQATKGAPGASHPRVQKAATGMAPVERAAELQSKSEEHFEKAYGEKRQGPLLRGKKGGVYYLSKSGQKVYAGKR